MKILHTADWHLGKKLYTFERLEEQKDVLAEIADIADQEEIDMILIAGDLFDTVNPGSDATAVLYSYLKKLTSDGRRPVIAIAGNHDSAERINAPDVLARECGIVLIGYPNESYPPLGLEHWAITRSGTGWIEITVPSGDKVSITTSAFTNEVRLKEFISEESEETGLINYFSNHWNTISKDIHSDDRFNILLAHLLIWPGSSRIIPQEDDGEKSINLGHTSVIPAEIIPPTYDYVALGHLHRSQKIPGQVPIYYSGSPLCYSFSESNQNKYVHIVTTENNRLANVEKKTLKTGKKLLTNTFRNLNEAEEWISEHSDHHLEIQLYVDEFMSSEDNKRLRSRTNNHLNIIPVVSSKDKDENDKELIVNNFSNITETFKAFFKEENNMDVNEELLDLFQEILSLNEEEEP